MMVNMDTLVKVLGCVIYVFYDGIYFKNRFIEYKLKANGNYILISTHYLKLTRVLQ